MYIHVHQIKKIKDLVHLIFYVTQIIENTFHVTFLYKIDGKGTCYTWREKFEKFADALAKKKKSSSWLVN